MVVLDSIDEELHDEGRPSSGKKKKNSKLFNSKPKNSKDRSESDVKLEKTFVYPKEDCELLSGDSGERLVGRSKDVVEYEYDRAVVEGGRDVELLRLNKKHIYTVNAYAMLSIDILKARGIEFSEVQTNVVKIESYLHDVMKTPVERTNFEKDNEYYKEQLSHSGFVVWITELLNHGSDSAEYSDMFLEGLGVSEKTRKKIVQDINEHMGMPFVEFMYNGEIERYIEDLSTLREIVLTEDEVNQDLLDRIDTELKTIPNLVGRKGKGLHPRYPEPTSPEAAVLRVADFCSLGGMAGADLDKDRSAGGFDKIVGLELGLKGDFEAAFMQACSSLNNNLDRLKVVDDDAPIYEKTESIIVEEIGGQIREKFSSFESWLRKEGIIGSEGPKPPATMDFYYECVRRFREWQMNGKDEDGKIEGFDPQNIVHQ